MGVADSVEVKAQFGGEVSTETRDSHLHNHLSPLLHTAQHIICHIPLTPLEDSVKVTVPLNELLAFEVA